MLPCKTGFWMLVFLLLVARAPHAFGAGVAPTATIPFEENQGQFNEQVAFAARTFDGMVFVTHEGKIVYALSGGGSVRARHAVPLRASRYADGPVGAIHESPLPPAEPSFGLALYETLVGADAAQVHGVDPAPTQVSTFIGNDPTRWHSDLPTFERVNLGEVYPGIRLQLVAHGNNVEKVFVVEPGAHPERIRLQITGAERLSVGPWGELQVDTALGPVTFTAPVAYQPEGEPVGAQHAAPLPPVAPTSVAVAYEVTGSTYGFRLGSYDRSRPLVIDPLLASTRLGGDDYTESNAVAVSADNRIYVAGYTQADNFPTTPGAYIESLVVPGGWFAYVSRFSPDLRYLEASTLLGGTQSSSPTSRAMALAFDPEGNIYVAGNTSFEDFPMIQSGYDTTYNGHGDVFLVKLDADLTQLLAGTYLGGGQGEITSAMQLDADGNIYVSGYAMGSGFPVTPGAYDTTFNGEQNTFAAKLNGELTELLAATYFGDAYCENRGMALDITGSVYLHSYADSGMPTTPDAYDRTCGSYGDVHIGRLDGDLTTLLAGTYLGGGDSEGPRSLAVAVDGSVLVGGSTASYNFPVTPGAFSTYHDHTNMAFISKLDENLTTLLASTYIPGAEITNHVMFDGA